MQLTRLLFLTPEKTYERKIKEIILAFQIEKNFTKEEIFTLYCNQIYFGHGNYGVEAASRFFFSKSVKDLTLAEAALVAGVPQNAPRLSPIDYPERALARRNHVLERMAEEKYVSREEAEAAEGGRRSGCTCARTPPSIAPHFLEEVRKYLEREYGSQRIYQGGLRVYTTLDPGMQRAAVRALRDGLRALDRRARGFVQPEASLLADGLLPEPLHLDEWDWPFAAGDVVRGVVIASDRMTRGRPDRRLPRAALARRRRLDAADERGRGAAARGRWRRSGSSRSPRPTAARRRRSGSSRSRRSRARSWPSTCARAPCGPWSAATTSRRASSTARRRPCGRWARPSSPIVYAAALETLGWTPSTILVDAPLSFPNPWNKTVWTPQNYDGAYLGPIPLRRAVEQSRNIPAVKTLQAVGVEKGIEYARKLGLAGELPPYLPIALGAGEATLMEMVGAYATFANQGLRMKPFLIERITDRDGNVIEQATPRATRRAAGRHRLHPDLAPARRRRARHRGAGRDASSGPSRARRAPRTTSRTPGSSATSPRSRPGSGSASTRRRTPSAAARRGPRRRCPSGWTSGRAVTADRPVEEYPIPGNVVFVPVDEMGRPGAPGAPGVRMEAFVAGTEPRAVEGAPPTEPALSLRGTGFRSRGGLPPRGCRPATAAGGSPGSGRARGRRSRARPARRRAAGGRPRTRP